MARRRSSTGSFRGFGNGVGNPRNGPYDEVMITLGPAQREYSYDYEDSLNHFNWSNGGATDEEYATYLTNRLEGTAPATSAYLSLSSKLRQVFERREEATYGALGVPKAAKLKYMQDTAPGLLKEYMDAVKTGDEAKVAAALQKLNAAPESSYVLEKKDEMQRLAAQVTNEEMNDALAFLRVGKAEGRLSDDAYRAGVRNVYGRKMKFESENGLPTGDTVADLAELDRQIRDGTFDEERDLALSFAETQYFNGKITEPEFRRQELLWKQRDIEQAIANGASPGEVSKLRADVTQKQMQARVSTFEDDRRKALAMADFALSTKQITPQQHTEVDRYWTKRQLEFSGGTKLNAAEKAEFEAKLAGIDRRLYDLSASDAAKVYRDSDADIDYRHSRGVINDAQSEAEKKALFQRIQGDARLSTLDPESYRSMYTSMANGVRNAEERTKDRQFQTDRAQAELDEERATQTRRTSPAGAIQAMDEELVLRERNILSYRARQAELRRDPNTNPAELTRLESSINSEQRAIEKIGMLARASEKVVEFDAGSQEYRVVPAQSAGATGMRAEITVEGRPVTVFYPAQELMVSVPVRAKQSADGVNTWEWGSRSVKYVTVPITSRLDGRPKMWTAIQDPSNPTHYSFINPDVRNPATGRAYTLQEYGESLSRSMQYNQSGKPIGEYDDPALFQAAMEKFYTEKMLIKEESFVGDATAGIRGTHPIYTKDDAFAAPAPFGSAYYATAQQPLYGDPALQGPQRPVYGPQRPMGSYSAVYPAAPSSAYTPLAAAGSGFVNMASDARGMYPQMAGDMDSIVRNGYGLVGTIQQWVDGIAGSKGLSGRNAMTQIYETKVGYIKGRDIHGGLDIRGRTGTDIPAFGAGTVVEAKDNGGWGNTVVVQMQDGTQMRYAHLHSLNVSVGQYVGAGTVVGKLGNTGHSDGEHLHFEVKRGTQLINPLERYATPQSIVAGVQPINAQWAGAIQVGTTSALAFAERNDDMTAHRIDEHLRTQGSPMLGQGQTFVSVGKQYGVDPMLLVSITGADSSYGKKLSTAYNPGNVFNTDAGRRVAFTSWFQGIEAIAKYALNGSFMRGFKTLGQLVGVYATDPNWINNVMSIYGKVRGAPVDKSTGFRIEPGQAAFGQTMNATSGVTGIVPRPASAEDVRKLFRDNFWKEPTAADLANWTSNGMNTAQVAANLQQFQESVVKRQISGIWSKLFYNGHPPADIVNGLYAEWEKTKTLTRERIVSFSEPLLDTYLRKQAGLPTAGNLTVEQTERLKLQRAKALEFVGSKNVEGPPPAAAGPAPDFAGSTMRIDGPQGQQLSLRDLMGGESPLAIQPATVTPQETTSLAPPRQRPGAELAPLQRDYIRRTGDEQLGGFQDFLRSYDSGTPLEMIKTGGAPISQQRSQNLDSVADFNTSFEGVSGMIFGNAQDYMHSLVRSGMQEQEAVKKTLDMYTRDKTAFNQRVPKASGTLAAAPSPVRNDIMYG